MSRRRKSKWNAPAISVTPPDKGSQITLLCLLYNEGPQPTYMVKRRLGITVARKADRILADAGEEGLIEMRRRVWMLTEKGIAHVRKNIFKEAEPAPEAEE